MSDATSKDINNLLSFIKEKNNPIKKRNIDKETREWSRNLETQLPINESELPKFKGWVNWNGFNFDRNKRDGHRGFDFASYLTKDNEIILGLSPTTKIRAVADGIVRQVLDIYRGYAAMITLEHGADDSGMFSQYAHVKPIVKAGLEVKKGDVIAELYKDPGDEEGRLVHLHLELTSGWGTKGTPAYGGGVDVRLDDPILLSSGLYRYRASPQGSSEFTVPALPTAKVEIANFKKVKVN